MSQLTNVFLYSAEWIYTRCWGTCCLLHEILIASQVKGIMKQLTLFTGIWATYNFFSYNFRQMLLTAFGFGQHLSNKPHMAFIRAVSYVVGMNVKNVVLKKRSFATFTTPMFNKLWRVKFKKNSFFN